jgi:hypothetical protein
VNPTFSAGKGFLRIEFADAGFASSQDFTHVVLSSIIVIPGLLKKRSTIFGLNKTYKNLSRSHFILHHATIIFQDRGSQLVRWLSRNLSFFFFSKSGSVKMPLYISGVPERSLDFSWANACSVALGSKVALGCTIL